MHSEIVKIKFRGHVPLIAMSINVQYMKNCKPAMRYSIVLSFCVLILDHNAVRPVYITIPLWTGLTCSLSSL